MRSPCQHRRPRMRGNTWVLLGEVSRALPVWQGPAGRASVGLPVCHCELSTEYAPVVRAAPESAATLVVAMALFAEVLGAGHGFGGAGVAAVARDDTACAGVRRR